jgi:MFS family permease
MAVKYTPYRWFILLLFSIANAITSIHWMLFSPIVSKVIIAYKPDATDDNINMMAMSYFIMISIDNPLCAWISEKFGLRNAILISCFVMLIGGIVKSFMNSNFYLLLVGQFIVATVFPMVYINSAKVSANWFPKEERVITTMIGM